jgi:OOP family OmpA-OmpF porin
MNKLLCTTISLAAALAAAPAQAADDFYAGFGLSNAGKLSLSTSAGRTQNINKPRPFSLYGGYKLNDNFAVEAGYSDFGTFKFGSGAELDLSALYVAGKGSVNVSDSFTLFAKAGVARIAVDKSGPGYYGDDFAKVRPMLGIGAGYRLSERATVELELVKYSKINNATTNLKVNQLRLGANYRF